MTVRSKASELLELRKRKRTVLDLSFRERGRGMFLYYLSSPTSEIGINRGFAVQQAFFANRSPERIQSAFVRRLVES